MDSTQLKKHALESTIFRLSEDNETAFMGAVLQCLSIRYDDRIPTAGITFDTKTKNFVMLLGSDFFVNKLDETQRKAVMMHELFHVTHKHVFFDSPEGIDKMRLNVAMDLCINQLIKGLPKEAMIVENFKDENGKVFPKNAITEKYYALLEKATYHGPKSENGNGKGNGTKVSDMLGQGNELEFDKHEWEMSDTDAKEKLEAVRDLMQRAIHKTSFGHTRVPNEVKELLAELDTKLAKLNYRAILLSTLKKSMPSKDIRKTWKRPSRRYGDLAKGNTLGIMPKIEVLIDTSGSISIEEANEFLQIVNNFLNVGVDKATINLFHTSVYHTQRVKKNAKVAKEVFQSGGTDLTDAFSRVIKSRPDLVIVLTDGYWSLPEVNLKKIPQTVFVISKNGTTNHPMKDIGKTVKYA